MAGTKKFFSELLRRKVIRLLGAYVAIFWLLAQGFASLFPYMGVPDWVLQAFIFVGIAAIPFLALFSWKYDLVPPQLVRDSVDVAQSNPGLHWARVRHDSREAGHILLRWDAEDGAQERRFFHPVSIGREPGNDIELADRRVSRQHAVLWAESGLWHVRDLESGNGTFIGHAKVAGRAELPGTCTLRFHVAGPCIEVYVARSEQTRIG